MIGSTNPHVRETPRARRFVTSEANGYAELMRTPSSRLRRILLLALCASFASSAAQAGKLYKWVDANGVTHFSDVPADGAQPITVDGAQSYHAPASRVAAPLPGASPLAGPASGYSSLVVTAPADGAVLWNADGHITVAAALEPALTSGHHLWFELDGTRHEASGASTDVEAPRGEHSLVAVVTDQSGAEVARSAAVSFAVRQNSAVTPPQGPSLPKKPHR